MHHFSSKDGAFFFDKIQPSLYRADREDSKFVRRGKKFDLGLVIGKISNSLFCPLVSSQKEFTIWIRSDQKGVVLALPQTRMDFWFAPKGVSRMMFPHQRQMVNKVTFPYLVRSEWSFEWVRSSKEKDRSVWYPLSPTHAWFAPLHSYFSSTFDCDENGTISKVIPFFL